MKLEKPKNLPMTAEADKSVQQAENQIVNIPVELVENLEKNLLTKLEEFCGHIEDKNKYIGDKLANMMTLANFEGKLIELMLQNKHFTDGRGQAAYEQLKEYAKDITINSLGNLSDTTNLKLSEELMAAKDEIAALQVTVEKAKQSEIELQEKCNKLRDENNQNKDQIKACERKNDEYKKLIIWYEKLVMDVPTIRKKNSSLLWSQNWDSALSEYIHGNPKPKISK
jgi:chromosome segregation ATPase